MRATDFGALSFEKVFAILVADQNEAPFVLSPLENATGVYGLGLSVTFPGDTFTDPDFGQSLSYSASGLPPEITFDSATRTFSGMPASVGPSTVTVAATDDGLPPLSVSTTFTLTIDQATQAISFATVPDHTYGAAPFTISATASSGLPVTFTSLAPSVATVSGNTVTIVGAGTATIRASQAGDANYVAATDVDRTFTVAQVTPIITWATPADIPLGTALSEAQLNATADVPGTFTYDPPAGTMLNSGDGQMLQAVFMPADSTLHRQTSTTRRINVLFDLIGSVWAWGDGGSGQLGNGQTGNSTFPVAVTAPAAWSGHTVVSVAADANCSLAVLDDGSVWAWGSLLGNGQTGNSAVPVAVTAPAAWSGHAVVSVAAGAYHSLVVLDDGSVWAWGLNGSGQLGNNSTAPSFVPVAVQAPTAWSGHSVVSVAAGDSHSLAVLEDGSVWAWGTGAFGQLGNGQTDDSTVPVPVAAPAAWNGYRVVTVAAGARHSMVLGEPNAAPSLVNSIAGQEATYGTPFTFTVPPGTFTDPDAGQILGYAASGLPAWLTFDADTATFSGTPDGIGTSTLTLTATDTGTPALSANTTFDLVVGKAVLTATGDRIHRFYGEENPPLTGIVEGVVNGDNITASYSTSATSASPAGAWTIAVTLNDPDNRLGNYEVTNVNGVLYVDPAPQTITFGAIPAHVYGDAPFTVPVSASSGLPVTLTSSATLVGTVSGNTLTITGAGTTLLTAYQPGDANYQAATFVQVSYSVGKATPVITWATPAAITSSEALSAAQLNATADVPGSFSYSPASGIVLARGTHTLAATFTPDIPANYMTASAAIELSVLNSSPLADGQSVNLAEDSLVAITLTGSDVDGDTLAYTIITGPNHGTLSGSLPNAIYRPFHDYSGPDAFTFTTNDGQVDSVSATVSVTVTPVNDLPVGIPASIAVLEDTSTPIRLSAVDDEGSGFAQLHSFSGGEGATVRNGVILASDGLLYGTTYVGGTANLGVVYRVSLDGEGFEVLHHFTPATGGTAPVARVIEGVDGRLYGTTSTGGAKGRGVVYRLERDGSGYQV